MVRRQEQSDIPVIRLANGQSVNIQKKVEFSIEIAQKRGRKKKVRQFFIKFYVVPGLTCNIILGTEFLKTHQAIIDFSQCTIALKKPIDVHTHDDLLIPARCEVVNLVTLNENVPPNFTGIVTGTPALAKRNLIAAKVLVKSKLGKIPMRLVNPTAVDVHVSKGTRIGTCSFECLPRQCTIAALTDGDPSNQKKLASPGAPQKTKFKPSQTNSVVDGKQQRRQHDLTRLDEHCTVPHTQHVMSWHRDL